MSGIGTAVTLSVFAIACLSLGCGQTDPGPGAPAAAGSAAGATDGGSAGSDDGTAADADAVALDASDCATRPLATCDGVQLHYDSNDSFEQTPALTPCSSFNSFDGCGSLIFEFDARGCAASIAPGSGGWQASSHLSELQRCLADIFKEARWACLASSRVRYDESCFVP